MQHNQKHTRRAPQHVFRNPVLPLLGLSLTAIATGFPAHAQGLTHKADTFLTHAAQTPQQSGWTSVIVRTAGTLTPEQESQLTATRAYVYRRLPIIHSLAVRVPNRNLNRLAALPFVQHLSSDAIMHKTDEFTVESSGASMAFQQYSLTGQGVRVAVIDSGVHTQADFGNPTIPNFPKPVGGSSRLIAQVNFVPDKNGKLAPSKADDPCGHGTHVAGILGGNGTNSSQNNCYRHFFGIAPQADLLNVRVLDENGQGTVSQVIAGIQWVLNNQATYHVRIINLSVGHPVGESYTTDPLCQAVEQAWKAGIVVVVAAGNEGRMQDAADPSLDNEGYGTNYGSIQSPGNDPYVITVGAVKATDMVVSTNGTWTHNRANDRIATYSSRGPSRLDLVLKPDIVAPGNKVISVDAAGCTLNTVAGNTNNIIKSQYMNANKGQSTKVSGDYFRLSGTSMATPVVSGAAALLLQKDPTLTPDTIKARLMLSADKWTQPDGTADPCTFGAGYLNIPAALQQTFTMSVPAASPALRQDANGNVYISADRAIWGNYTPSVDLLRAIWGTRAIWGSGAISSSRALWGTSVWSDRAIWGKYDAAADLSTTAVEGD